MASLSPTDAERRAEFDRRPASGSLRQLARIDEADCIGCTMCIRACPVDAIVGAAKHMHTVVAQWCTGCQLCLPPCPVDCIVFEPAPESARWTDESVEEARRREEARARRLGLDTTSPVRAGPVAARADDVPIQTAAILSQGEAQTELEPPTTDRRHAVIQGAIERARARARARARG